MPNSERVLPEKLDALLPHRLQRTGYECDDQQPDPEEKDIEEREQRRDKQAPPPDRHAVDEDDRHRVFQNRERERAEEDKGDEQNPADDVAMREEQRELLHDRPGLPGHDQLQIAAERCQQRCFVDEAGQPDQHEDQQRQDREQRVVGDRTGQQVPLVGAKAPDHPQRKGTGMLQQIRCLGREHAHFPGWRESGASRFHAFRLGVSPRC